MHIIRIQVNRSDWVDKGGRVEDCLSTISNNHKLDFPARYESVPSISSLFVQKTANAVLLSTLSGKGVNPPAKGVATGPSILTLICPLYLLSVFFFFSTQSSLHLYRHKMSKKKSMSSSSSSGCRKGAIQSSFIVIRQKGCEQFDCHHSSTYNNDGDENYSTYENELILAKKCSPNRFLENPTRVN